MREKREKSGLELIQYYLREYEKIPCVCFRPSGSFPRQKQLYSGVFLELVKLEKGAVRWGGLRHHWKWDTDGVLAQTEAERVQSLLSLWT